MSVTVGTIYNGKVTGVKAFGAFVRLEDGTSGLVHISEVSGTYVEDLSSHLQEGQEVLVKVVGIDANSRVNLSIKQAQPDYVEPPKREERPRREERPARQAYGAKPQAPKEPEGFEDRLKQFMQESQSRMSGLEMYAGAKKSRKRR